MSVTPKRSTLLRPLLFAVALGALAACSSSPEKDAPTFVSVQDYLKTAYQPAQHYKFDGWNSHWSWAGHQLDVALIVPSEQKNVPLIIYLPGLGEDPSAGDLWRQTWVDAGYAVLSLQAPRFQHSLYSTSDAQAGAFQTIAQRSFAPASLRSRVEDVNQVMAEVKRRAAAGEAGYSAIDSQRLVIAGFDLGAQTAAAVSGERDPGEPRAVAWKPLASILLSPYVEGGTDPSRFGQIDTPVLSVTGPLDEDPFSWVATARQREDLYNNLGALGGYQLKLQDATHQGLSGTLALNKRKKDKDDHSPVAGTDAGADGGEHPRSGGHEPAPNPFDKNFDVRQAASVAAVTTAFLDATVKQSPQARQWLDQHAPQWLEKVGSLQRKGSSAP